MIRLDPRATREDLSCSHKRKLPTVRCGECVRWNLVA